MPFLIFCGLFLLLFFLSQKTTKLLSHLFQKLFKKQTTTIYLLSFLFLPGVVLHELSHLLVANLLFVQTGEIEFFPEIHGTSVKMGSVAIVKTDPFRRFIIGIAPVIGGFGILLLASSYVTQALFSVQNVLFFYVVFQVGNTMFSSSKDMEGALGFLIGIILLVGILELFGLPVWQFIISNLSNKTIVAIFIRLDTFLLLALGIDIFLLLFFEGLVQLWERHH